MSCDTFSGRDKPCRSPLTTCPRRSTAIRFYLSGARLPAERGCSPTLPRTFVISRGFDPTRDRDGYRMDTKKHESAKVAVGGHKVGGHND